MTILKEKVKKISYLSTGYPIQEDDLSDKQNPFLIS